MLIRTKPTVLSFKEGPSNNRVFVQISDLDNRTQRGIRQGFFRLGARFKQELNKQVLEKNKTGRTYIRRDRAGRRRRHVASAAGQTPANMKGNYRRNIGFQLRGAQLEVGIREGAPYAKFLEEGTKRMAPRPGVGNTVKSTARDARTFFVGSLMKELNAK